MAENYVFNLQEEADYVLGMMDMYSNDSEVSGLLKMKGLSDEQVSRVLQEIKKEGYKKRIKQSRKILVIGIGITVILGISWLFLGSSGMYNKKDELMNRVNAGMMIRIVFYGFIFGITQIIFGCYRLITYSLKLRKAEQIL